MVPINTPGLSPAQIEVLKLVHSGAMNYEIARSLDISLNTVKMHLKRASKKMRKQQ